WLLNMQSGRRIFDSTVMFFDAFPDALGAHLFAENMPEIHATELIKRYGKKYVIAGPSGVGLLVAGHMKLGAIGGIGALQLEQGKLTQSGAVAVVATSGGMTNELITAVALAGRRTSFSLCIGGDRFPVTSLTDVLTLAENDAETKAVVYFGELGGSDEYEIVDLLKEKKLTKPIVCYIAGVIDEAFSEHMQFGHAKALVAHKDESARAKRRALADAGAIAPDTFPAFLEALRRLPESPAHDTVMDIDPIMNRKQSILSTREIVDLDEVPQFVKNGKLAKQKDNAFADASMRALLGRPVDTLTAAFVENIFELLIDHGGLVSGAVNTMITARAGKDMVSSLAAGLLTVGPRFGGAVNEAARVWHEGVTSKANAADFVESNTRGGKLLLGIGHRKYRVGIPDPRVAALAQFATLLKHTPHYDFARAVEAVTTAKNGNLILNVDGVMAALLLDLLSEKDGMSDPELNELIDAEFFNALFIIPRSVGFIGHFIEQKRNDEGLFRLPEELLFERKKEDKKRE
ncbi:MAG: citrate/2-methylcitrate synthase, partial [Candidatus Paceibacterota bacterium]